MIQLYGNLRSRATRCLWMLGETGQPYQLIEKSTRADDLQTAEYARLNPNARIPTLVDGDVTLWESMAINIYLAQRYDGPLHLAGPKELGLTAQWSFWAVLEMEQLLLALLEHRATLPEFARDPSQVERSELLLRKPLGVLNDRLTGREYLAGDSFTVADLNVASILAWGRMARLNLSACSEVARWLDACMARPAYRRVRDQAKRK
jgi:glutathione S-transferase